MKANEVMMGDWVVGGSGEPFKIGIIDGLLRNQEIVMVNLYNIVFL